MKREITNPDTALEAYEAIQWNADAIGMSIWKLCKAADVHSPTVYRWQKNLRSYDIALYRAVMLKSFEIADKMKRANKRGS